MTDILNDLSWLSREIKSEGARDDAREFEVIKAAVIEITLLRATIDQLRAVAGAVSIESGLTFADIKKRQGAMPDNG